MNITHSCFIVVDNITVREKDTLSEKKTISHFLQGEQSVQWTIYSCISQEVCFKFHYLHRYCSSKVELVQCAHRGISLITEVRSGEKKKKRVREKRKYVVFLSRLFLKVISFKVVSFKYLFQGHSRCQRRRLMFLHVCQTFHLLYTNYILCIPFTENLS